MLIQFLKMNYCSELFVPFKGEVFSFLSSENLFENQRNLNELFRLEVSDYLYVSF